MFSGMRDQFLGFCVFTGIMIKAAERQIGVSDVASGRNSVFEYGDRILCTVMIQKFGSIAVERFFEVYVIAFVFGKRLKVGSTVF